MSIGRQYQVVVPKGKSSKPEPWNDLPNMPQPGYQVPYPEEKAETVKALEKSLAAPKQKKASKSAPKYNTENPNSPVAIGVLRSMAPDGPIARSGKTKKLGNRIDTAIAEAIEKLPGHTTAHIEAALEQYALGLRQL
jgi:hypothetical protein